MEFEDTVLNFFGVEMKALILDSGHAMLLTIGHPILTCQLFRATHHEASARCHRFLNLPENIKFQVRTGVR